MICEESPEINVTKTSATAPKITKFELRNKGTHVESFLNRNWSLVRWASRWVLPGFSLMIVSLLPPWKVKKDRWSWQNLRNHLVSTHPKSFAALQKQLW